MGNYHFSINYYEYDWLLFFPSNDYDYEYEYFILTEPFDYEYDYLVDNYSNIKKVKESSETSLIIRKIPDNPKF